MPLRSIIRKQARATGIESLEHRRLLSSTVSPLLILDPSASSSNTVQGYTPAQIRVAYNVDGATLSNGSPATGAGQTIAIIDAYSDPEIVHDLKIFDRQFDLPTPLLTVVSQTGSTTNLPAENAGWDGEISLDVEWAHAVAPDANILLVETNSDNTSDLLAGVNYARSVADAGAGVLCHVQSLAPGALAREGRPTLDVYAAGDESARPALAAVLHTGAMRGLISGLGVLDIWIGISEAVHYRDHRP